MATALQAVAEGTPKGTAGTIINILSGLDGVTAAAFDAVSGEGTTGDELVQWRGSHRSIIGASPCKARTSLDATLG